MSKGTLFIVPSSLGEDGIHVIPDYVIQQVRSIKDFYVEDLRSARRFLRKLDREFDIDGSNFIEYDKRSKQVNSSDLNALKEGRDMALISEAGLPCVADPGASLVALAHELGYSVYPLVGPSSIFLALMASGLNGQDFHFHGYLPIKQNERVKALKNLEREALKGTTVIFMETPYRNNALLSDVLENITDDVRLCIASNITLKNQKIKTERIGSWKKHKPDLHKQPSIFLLNY